MPLWPVRLRRLWRRRRGNQPLRQNRRLLLTNMTNRPQQSAELRVRGRSGRLRRVEIAAAAARSSPNVEHVLLQPRVLPLQTIVKISISQVKPSVSPQKKMVVGLISGKASVDDISNLQSEATADAASTPCSPAENRWPRSVDLRQSRKPAEASV